MSATTTTTKKVKVSKVSKDTKEQDTLSKQYQKKSDKEHVLDNPDTYIGSREKVDETLWIFSEGKSEGKLEEGGNVEVSSETSSEVGSVAEANKTPKTIERNFFKNILILFKCYHPLFLIFPINLLSFFKYIIIND